MLGSPPGSRQRPAVVLDPRGRRLKLVIGAVEETRADSLRGRRTWAPGCQINVARHRIRFRPGWSNQGEMRKGTL